MVAGRAVLLATARVLIKDQHDRLHTVRALIDPGFETSIVAEALAQRLRLPRASAAVAIFGVGGQRTPMNIYLMIIGYSLNI